MIYSKILCNSCLTDNFILNYAARRNDAKKGRHFEVSPCGIYPALPEVLLQIFEASDIDNWGAHYEWAESKLIVL